MKTNLLTACQMAYRKHVLDDGSIGWDELGIMLYDAICNEIGDDDFVMWIAEQKRLETSDGKK